MSYECVYTYAIYICVYVVIVNSIHHGSSHARVAGTSANHR